MKLERLEVGGEPQVEVGKVFAETQGKVAAIAQRPYAANGNVAVLVLFNSNQWFTCCVGSPCAS